MKKIAVIVAGGSGVRMGGDMPKQFLQLMDRPIVWHSMKAFSDAFDDIEIVLVCHENYLYEGEKLMADFPAKKVSIVKGGVTRFHSVKAGLANIESPAIVFVHDAVRCLVTPELIQICYNTALEKGSAIPAIRANDSMRVLEKGNFVVLNREKVRIIQTPQVFQSGLILSAFQQEYKDSFTDEATVLEAFGEKIYLVEGAVENIKITRPIDLVLAEAILKSRQKRDI